MSLEYSTQSMGMIKTLFEGSGEQTVDCDISLPDYCPDISRILKCCVIPCIESAKISGDRACAEGHALIRIIYADEENNICTYEQNFPFSKFVQLNADTQGALSVKNEVQYTNCRAVSKRRIDVHSLIYVFFTINSVNPINAIDRFATEAIQTKTEDISFSDLINTECKTFAVSETVELPENCLPAERIVSCCASPVVSDTRVVQDKILIKGEIDITLNYCAAENHGEVAKFNHTIPLNQVVDIQGITDNSTPTVSLKSLGCECVIRNDANSTPRLIEINCNLIADINAFIKAQTRCITDAYSVDGQLNTSYENREILCLCDKIHETAMENFIIDLSTLEAQKICCLWWDSSKVNSALHDGKLRLHTTVPLNIMAVDTDGRPVFCEREVDFEFTKAIDKNACRVKAANVIPVGFSTGTPANGKAEIKGEFLIDANTFTCKEINVLAGAEMIPSDKKISASIVVYFPQKEENLWSIAKQFNTTSALIKEQNNLSEECAQAGKPLLIPVM